MTTQSKLHEKSARIPEVRASKWDSILAEYLQDIDKMQTEDPRSVRFAQLVVQLLGVDTNFIGNYAKGIEKSIKVEQTDRILKGRADNLFGNVIIEFEKNIPKKQVEAEEQLRRYAAILWSQESSGSRTPYLCIATDGIRFLTFTPVLKDASIQQITPDDVRLELLESADWKKFSAEEVYFWLDRYLRRQEVLRPTSETIVADFGPTSHAYKTSIHALLSLWGDIRKQNAFSVVFDSWKQYLRVVYGSDVANNELFMRHTYLATLAKLMAWRRITEETELPNDAHILEMLQGELFAKLGIENFLEEDFFSWLSRAEAQTVAVSMARGLFSLLQNYNLHELSEDVLKSLYQGLVDPQERRYLGEFYTPDWLAHRIVNKLLDVNPNGSMLDPTCGSGTFIYLAIREKRQRLGNSQATLHHILDAVCGSDIHPLAVIIAKTNYILALGDLLQKRSKGVAIPVYLADTLRLPVYRNQSKIVIGEDGFEQQLAGYEIKLEGRAVHLPQELIEKPSLYDQSIEQAKDFALQNKGAAKKVTLKQFRGFLQTRHSPLADNNALSDSVFSIVETLKHFNDIDRDSIWAFVLKNSYKPLFFRRRFDFIMGNPPWIVFRDMEPVYQEFLKEQITKEYKLLTGRQHLITHMEVATLFLLRAADLYLKTGGSIAFVLPRSVFSADQHDNLRRRSFKLGDSPFNLFWQEVWDCEHVKPLFRVPSCVIIAKKDVGAAQANKFTGEELSETLPGFNTSLASTLL